MSNDIGFLGLGALGTPIAENLLRSGKTMAVWNRTASKAEALATKGARAVATPTEAVSRGGVVFTMFRRFAEDIDAPAPLAERVALQLEAAVAKR